MSFKKFITPSKQSTFQAGDTVKYIGPVKKHQGKVGKVVGWYTNGFMSMYAVKLQDTTIKASARMLEPIKSKKFSKDEMGLYNAVMQAREIAKAIKHGLIPVEEEYIDVTRHNGVVKKARLLARKDTPFGSIFLIRIGQDAFDYISNITDQDPTDYVYKDFNYAGNSIWDTIVQKESGDAGIMQKYFKVKGTELYDRNKMVSFSSCIELLDNPDILRDFTDYYPKNLVYINVDQIRYLPSHVHGRVSIYTKTLSHIRQIPDIHFTADNIHFYGGSFSTEEIHQEMARRAAVKSTKADKDTDIFGDIFDI